MCDTVNRIYAKRACCHDLRGGGCWENKARDETGNGWVGTSRWTFPKGCDIMRHACRVQIRGAGGAEGHGWRQNWQSVLVVLMYHLVNRTCLCAGFLTLRGPWRCDVPGNSWPVSSKSSWTTLPLQAGLGRCGVSGWRWQLHADHICNDHANKSISSIPVSISHCDSWPCWVTQESSAIWEQLQRGSE